MVYGEYKSSMCAHTATESNGNVWIVSQDCYWEQTLKVTSDGRFTEDVLTFAYEKKDENILRFVEIRDITYRLYGRESSLAIFLTSGESKKQYPIEYEKMVTKLSKENSKRREKGDKLLSLYD